MPAADSPKEIASKLITSAGCEAFDTGPLPRKLDENKVFQFSNFNTATLGDGDSYAQYYVGGKTPRHLFRLLFPIEYRRQYDADPELDALENKNKIKNTVCETFAKEYLSFVAGLGLKPKGEKEEAGLYGASKIIGGEVTGLTRDFWILAPYIHDELKKSGLSSDQSMAKVFQWVKKAGERINNINRFKELEVVDTGQYFLGIDERMPSHLLSRLFAKRIVEYLQKEK